MSLGQISRTGAKVPIAGLNSGELVPSVSYYQKGSGQFTVPASNSPTALSDMRATITFDTPMPDEDYIIVLTNEQGAEIRLDKRNITKNGFVIQGVNTINSAVSCHYNWQAFKLMTDADRALDEQAIAEHTKAIATANDSIKKRQVYARPDSAGILRDAAAIWGTSSTRAALKAYAENGGLIWCGIIQWTGNTHGGIIDITDTQQAGTGRITGTNQLGTIAFNEVPTWCEMYYLGAPE